MSSAIPSIDQLKELSLPAPVSYAPQTWGWWVLLALLIATALVLGARQYWLWQRNRYRREALVRLAELNRSESLDALRELPELLKRTALSMPTAHPVGASLLAKAIRQSASSSADRASSRAGSLPQGTAALRGEDWQHFLQSHVKQPLPADFSAQLALLAYAPEATLRALPAEQRQHLFATCKTWVEQHHVAA